MAKRIPMPAPRKMLLADAISEAIGEIQSLAEECREVVDNAGDGGLSQTQRILTLGETADSLENIQEPDAPESLNEVEVSIQDPKPRRRGYSRADRCGHACYMLDECMVTLQEFMEKNVEGDAHDDAETLHDELDNAKSEAEGVEFLGMYG